MKKFIFLGLLITVLFTLSSLIGIEDTSNFETTPNIGGSSFSETFEENKTENREKDKSKTQIADSENREKDSEEDNQKSEINITSEKAVAETNLEKENNNDKNNQNDEETSRNNSSLLDEITEHQVKSGENLWTIADKYDVDINTIIGANDINNMNKIESGDTLRILPVKGIMYKINPGENLSSLSLKFDIPVDKIIEANSISNPDLIKPGATLILPEVNPEFGYEERLNDNFALPVNGRISSKFGPRWGKKHEGIDFAVNTGTEIKAAKTGTVVYSDWATGYGHTVIIEHQKGVRTLYAHNSELKVQGGQTVQKGEVIALSGNSGNSTGPHLHFEIQINGNPVDPLTYIN